MPQTYTVYFDSNFYVAVARASNGAADTALEALNDMDVRPVLSRTLLRELLSSADRPEKDSLLLHRVRRLRITPYVTAPGLSWDVLELSGPARRSAADFLGRLDEALVDAESASLLARAGNRLAAKAQAHSIAKLGFAKPDGSLDLAAIGAFFAPHLAGLGVTVPETFGEADLPQLAGQLGELLETLDTDEVERQQRLVASAVSRTDNRPSEILLGQASEKSKARLANTLRDANHMEDFAAHAEAIDFFQLDAPQHQALLRNPTHELRRLGLADRCFAAHGLERTVGEVGRLIESHGSRPRSRD